jgi:hypothetical protein
MDMRRWIPAFAGMAVIAAFSPNYFHPFHVILNRAFHPFCDCKKPAFGLQVCEIKAIFAA